MCGVPESMLTGELTRVSVEVFNVGQVALNSLRLTSSLRHQVLLDKVGVPLVIAQGVTPPPPYLTAAGVGRAPPPHLSLHPLVSSRPHPFSHPIHLKHIPPLWCVLQPVSGTAPPPRPPGAGERGAGQPGGAGGLPLLTGQRWRYPVEHRVLLRTSPHLRQLATEVLGALLYM